MERMFPTIPNNEVRQVMMPLIQNLQRPLSNIGSTSGSPHADTILAMDSVLSPLKNILRKSNLLLFEVDLWYSQHFPRSRSHHQV